MKMNLYPKLAWHGISKNKKTYVPFLLTSIGLVMMFYIVSYLTYNKSVKQMRGGDDMQMILSWGVPVVAFFVVIFLFYMNSFLMRRRKTEFGLYNILGMGKSNIARILLWQNFMLLVVSAAGGLGMGILLSKLAELCAAKMLSNQASLAFVIEPSAVRNTLFLTVLSFVLILLPLLVLAWQAWQSLNALSAQAAHINRTTLVDARRSEAMINAALEMERSYRQYCVLDDPTLARVYQNQRQRYSQMLDAHAGVLPDEKLWQALRQDVSDLAQLQCKNSGPDAQAAARLEVFASNNSDMVQATRAVVYSRGQQLQQEIAERGQFFGWQALVLFLLSLALVLLFTRMIIGPVKGIERMINQLGAGKSLDDAALFTGPRELRSVGKRIIWLSERLAWLESQRHQFLRHLSHELKTPLASMREGTELLADRVAGPLTPEQQEIVEILDSSSRNLQKLIEQLLDYNRKQADGPVAREAVDLVDLVENVVAAHSLPARAKLMHTELTLQARRIDKRNG